MNVVDNRLISTLETLAQEYVTGVRMNEGVQLDVLGALNAALAEVGDRWRGSDQIPKGIARILLELSSAVDSSAYLYEQPTRDEIIQISSSLLEQSVDILADPEC